jgi:hypothetical protein
MTLAEELRTAAEKLREASKALPPFHPEAATIAVRSTTSRTELQLSDKVFTALQTVALALGPSADWLETTAEHHPKRVGKELVIGQPIRLHDYCGTCQDWPMQAAQWPCPQLRQALAVARAINGTETAR